MSSDEIYLERVVLKSKLDSKWSNYDSISFSELAESARSGGDMKLHKMVLTKYNNAKTDVVKETFLDIDVDISPAGIVIQEADGVQHFVPSHMIVKAKFVNRYHAKVDINGEA